ncbi:MAG: sodium:solute symporter family protein [bacterium]
MDSVYPALMLYFIPLAYIVWRTRWARNRNEFNLASRTLPYSLVFASVAATYIGPGFSMGFIGKGYEIGMVYWLFGILYGIQTVIVGVWIAPRLRSFPNAHTLAGIYREKAGKIAHLLVGILSVGLCAGFSAVMIKAGSVLCSSFFGWPLWIGVSVTAIITMLYTISGGLKASVSTDGFQFLIFSIVLPFILLSLVFTNKFNAENAATTSAVIGSEFVRKMGWGGILGLTISFFLGERMIPPYASRALGAKNEKNAQIGFILAGLYAVLWFFIVISIGLAARQNLPLGTPEDKVLLSLLGLFPGVVRNLVGVSLVCVVISSLDSLLNSGGVAFTEDIVGIWGKGLTDRKALRLSRMGIVLITVIGCIGALKIKTIIDGLLMCYGVWAPAIVPSLIYILFRPNISKISVTVSILVGTGYSVLAQNGVISFSINPVLAGTCLACITIVAFHFGTRLCKR